jgi:hypothetical protein
MQAENPADLVHKVLGEYPFAAHDRQTRFFDRRQCVPSRKR